MLTYSSAVFCFSSKAYDESEFYHDVINIDINPVNTYLPTEIEKHNIIKSLIDSNDIVDKCFIK